MACKIIAKRAFKEMFLFKLNQIFFSYRVSVLRRFASRFFSHPKTLFCPLFHNQKLIRTCFRIRWEFDSLAARLYLEGLVPGLPRKVPAWFPPHDLIFWVGILKQNIKSRYSGIPGFEVRRNSKKFFNITIYQHCIYNSYCQSSKDVSNHDLHATGLGFDSQL